MSDIEYKMVQVTEFQIYFNHDKEGNTYRGLEVIYAPDKHVAIAAFEDQNIDSVITSVIKRRTIFVHIY